MWQRSALIPFTYVNLHLYLPREPSDDPPPTHPHRPLKEKGVLPTFLGTAGFRGRPSCAGCGVQKGTIP